MYSKCDAYRQSFVNPETGLLREDLLDSRNCPCCDSPIKSTLFVKNGGTYVKCNNCSMVFLDPVFKDNELIKYYENNNTAQAVAHEEEDSFYRQIYGLGLASIGKYCTNGSILDIGCSSGLFLDLSRDAGYQTHGIEINKTELQIARSKGHRVWGEPTNNISFTSQFNVISLWDVFEHIKDGVGFLCHLKSILNTNGIVFMQIPSSDSLAARILREDCNMFDGIEHVNLYNVATISQIASASGFSIVSMSSVIDELGPISNYLSYEDPYKGSFSITNVEKVLDKESILRNLLGYKLQVVLSLG